VLDLLLFAICRPEICLENPPKQFEKDLKAGFGNGRVVTPLAQLITDEGMLRPGKLVEAKDDSRLTKLLSDEVAAGVGDVRVLDAEDHCHLAPELGEQIDCVVAPRCRVVSGVGSFVRAEGTAVHIRCEVGDAGGDPRVQLDGEPNVSMLPANGGGVMDMEYLRSHGVPNGHPDTCLSCRSGRYRWVAIGGSRRFRTSPRRMTQGSRCLPLELASFSVYRAGKF
jgi:hypothetical protein